MDNSGFEQGRLDGAKDAAARSLASARRMLDTYGAAALDPTIGEAQLAFIREGEAVLPDKMD